MTWRTGIAILSFFALVGVIQYPRIAEFIRELPEAEKTVAVPDYQIAAPGNLGTPSSDSGQSNTRSVLESELTADDLKLLALDYLNKDRQLHGLAPLTMGDNTAAQLHADDMVAGRYLGHWWRDGRKPYMVYSETGGTSYASENAARTGFSDAEYFELCSVRDVSCDHVSPPEDVQRLHHAMVYDDASSEWRHRDNILNPGHSKVNIGIAFTEHFLALVQHFEGGDITAARAPWFNGSVLTIRADLNEPDLSIFPTVQVHYEEAPVERTTVEIEQFTSYCVGGGFSSECGEPIVQIVPPPRAGSRYLNLPESVIVADSWVVSGGDIEITADLGKFARQPGVYTTTLFKDSGDGVSGDLVLQLSTVR